MIILSLWLMATAVNQVEGSRPPADYWRNPLRCGPNSLYAYLLLNGRKCGLSDISSRVNIEPRGASFGDMRRAATELGVPSVVVKLDDSALAGVPLPAIAHFQNRGGHYRLLLHVAPKTVTTADLTTGQVEEMPRDAFLELWSGYLLIPDQGTQARWIIWSGGLSTLALILIYRGLSARPRQGEILP